MSGQLGSKVAGTAKWVPQWFDTVVGGKTKLGIMNLFVKEWAEFGNPAIVWTSKCETCHATSGASYVSYQPCYSCHTDSNGYAPWLDFTHEYPGGTLRGNSYYLPGRTRAESSIARTVDGTMPPFNSSPDQKWCDEVLVWMQDWIDGGYQRGDEDQVYCSPSEATACANCLSGGGSCTSECDAQGCQY